MMELSKPKEDFDSLEAENVENLTNNMKMACPTLDNAENVSLKESSSENLKDSDEKDLANNLEGFNENSLDKIARRPVESWKYCSFKTNDNKTSYKCSLCCSIYQHKKSLNKHWKDKHSTNPPTSSTATPVNVSVPTAPEVLHHHDITNIYPPDVPAKCPPIFTSLSGMNVLIKAEANLPQTMANITRIDENVGNNRISRKRTSFNFGHIDDKENFPPVQAKRLSLVQPLQQQNQLPLAPPPPLNGGPLVLRPSNLMNIPFNAVPTRPMPVRSLLTPIVDTVLDLRIPDHGAIDLRKRQSMIDDSLIYRCFQCTFRSRSAADLNQHFKLSHWAVLIDAKTFHIAVPLYQKMLYNQFSAVIRTEHDAMDSFNRCHSPCPLCSLSVPSRYELIFHLGVAHEFDTVWVCLVCGFGCGHPVQLSQHFQSHSNLQIIARPLALPLSQSSPSTSTAVWQPQQPLSSDGIVIKTEEVVPCGSSLQQQIVSNFLQSAPSAVATIIGNHLASSTPIANKCSKRSSSIKKEILSSSFDSISGGGGAVSGTAVVKEKTLKCLVCDATARWRSELFTHMITHSEHRSFGCKFCTYRSKWKWDVPKHLKRCRLAPAHVRKPDVQNSYLITLLQHYAPPPGDILYEFMKIYNIKDLGALNRSTTIKQDEEQSTSELEIKYEQMDRPPIHTPKYEDVSDCSDLDVGTDKLPEVDEDLGRIDEDDPLKCSIKQCPWCQDFLTTKPLEMSNHIGECHSDTKL